MCSNLLTAMGADKKPTVTDAKAFLDAAESKLLVLSVESSRADWVNKTYITDDTETLAAKGINIQVISTSEIKVSVLVASEYTELAVRALHTAYELDAA